MTNRYRPSCEESRNGVFSAPEKDQSDYRSVFHSPSPGQVTCRVNQSQAGEGENQSSSEEMETPYLRQTPAES